MLLNVIFLCFGFLCGAEKLAMNKYDTHFSSSLSRLAEAGGGGALIAAAESHSRCRAADRLHTFTTVALRSAES